MRRILALMAMLIGGIAAASATAAERPVWFGSYTADLGRDRPRSEGILVATFDDATGTLSEPRLAAVASDPSFLALHPALPRLYAVCSVPAEAGGRPRGAVAAFAIDDRTGGLEPLGPPLPSGGDGPCHVAVDPDGRVVLAANYGSGSVICLGLDAEGSLLPVVEATPGGRVQHEWAREGEAGIDSKRQAGPHAHSVGASPDGRFAFVCDLGLDRVFVHALDRDRATLAPHAAATLRPGAGPRHLAMHPDGRHAWCVNELDLTVTALVFDPEAGTLDVGETLSTLPADVGNRRGISTAEIAVHPNGRFLYASNRGHDSIAMYAIDPTTAGLTFLGTEPIHGRRPRSFAVDPSGRFLLAAGQDSDTISVLAIDPATGVLAFTGRTARVPSPVCIVFGRER